MKYFHSFFQISFFQFFNWQQQQWWLLYMDNICQSDDSSLGAYKQTNKQTQIEMKNEHCCDVNVWLSGVRTIKKKSQSYFIKFFFHFISFHSFFHPRPPPILLVESNSTSCAIFYFVSHIPYWYGCVCVYHLGDNRCFVFFFMKKKKKPFASGGMVRTNSLYMMMVDGRQFVCLKCILSVGFFLLLTFFNWFCCQFFFCFLFFLVPFDLFHFFPHFFFHFISFLLFFSPFWTVYG